MGEIDSSYHLPAIQRRLPMPKFAEAFTREPRARKFYHIRSVLNLRPRPRDYLVVRCARRACRRTWCASIPPRMLAHGPGNGRERSVSSQKWRRWV